MNATPKTSRPPRCRILPHLIAGVLWFAAAGVEAAPEQMEATRLEITVTATDNVNADDKNRAQPIEIRIYELKNSQSFDTSDFFSLHDKDREKLGPDLLRSESFILRPGERRKIERKSDSETTAIGILAGYRDLGRSTWRVTEKLPEPKATAWYRFAIPSNKLVLDIRAEESGLRVTRSE